MFDGDQTESCLVSGTQVLLTLLEGRRAGTEGLVDSFSQGLERLCPVSGSVLHGIEPRLKDFHQLLLSPPKKSAILTTIGVLEEPLGNARLHGARLVAALLHTNTPSINRELCRLNTMGLLLVSGRTGQGRRAGRSRSRCGPQSREAGAHAARSSSRGREAAAVPLCLRERPLQLCVNVPRERPSAAPLPEPSSDRGCACPACASRLPGGCPGSEQAVGARGRAPPRHTTLGSPGSPSALPVGLCS